MTESALNTGIRRARVSGGQKRRAGRAVTKNLFNRAQRSDIADILVDSERARPSRSFPDPVSTASTRSAAVVAGCRAAEGFHPVRSRLDWVSWVLQNTEVIYILVSSYVTVCSQKARFAPLLPSMVSNQSLNSRRILIGVSAIPQNSLNGLKRLASSRHADRGKQSRFDCRTQRHSSWSRTSRSNIHTLTGRSCCQGLPSIFIRTSPLYGQRPTSHTASGRMSS